jgi:hypothetical protein
MLFPMLNVLYFHISPFRSLSAVPNMAVLEFLISCLPSILPRYFLNNIDIVPFAYVVTCITFVFTFHVRCISIAMSLYFRISSASFVIANHHRRRHYDHHPNSLLHSSLAGSQKSMVSLTKRFLFTVLPKKLLTI